MKIVIVGAGEVGSHLCEILSRAFHDVVMIEKNETVANRLAEYLDVRVIRENGSSASALITAGVATCDHFLAVTSDDETNIVSSSLAKALGAKNTYTRVHDETYRESSVINYQSHFGIDHLLNPERLAAVELAKAIRSPGRVAVEDFGRGQIEVQLVKVQPRARVIGRSLADIHFRGRLRVGLVQRNSEVEIATGKTILREGDLVTLFGPPDAIFEAKPLFDPEIESEEPIRVVLLGGGEISISLVRLLSNRRFKIRIIEREYEQCRFLAGRFPQVTVVHGEGTSLRLLEEEQVGEADYFVACTKDDEDNVMTCLQASKLGTAHALLAINRADYIEVLNRLKGTLGLELAVSPRMATANEVLRYISTEPYVILSRLPNDSGLIVETKVAPNSACDGKSVKEISWPKDFVIVAHLHKFQAQTPTAEDVIFAGDRLVAIVRPQCLDEFVKQTS